MLRPVRGGATSGAARRRRHPQPPRRHRATTRTLAGGRLVYVGTDPVEVEVALDNGDQGIVDYLAPHCAVVHLGRELRQSRLPACPVRAVRVRADAAADRDGPLGAVQGGAGDAFSTVANWRQPYRTVTFRGEVYHWSKHLEFAKFLDLPRHCEQPFELALVNAVDDGPQMLTVAWLADA